MRRWRHGDRHRRGGAGRLTGTAVYVEVGAKRVFASALDWPGWCRSGRDEARALEALAAYASRFGPVAEAAGSPLPASAARDLAVVERVPGSATTDFGAPGAPAGGDDEPLTEDEAQRLAAFVVSSWDFFDAVVAGAPAELRKGPRGGGRDRDKMVDHVLAAEAAYARKLGLRLKQPHIGDRRAIASFRAAVAGALKEAPGPAVVEKGWPGRYAARRIAWHVLDHAWEMQDRSGSA